MSEWSLENAEVKQQPDLNKNEAELAKALNGRGDWAAIYYIVRDGCVRPSRWEAFAKACGRDVNMTFVSPCNKST